jgi:hypothetical protein
MPQPHRLRVPPVVVTHLLCSECLKPMRIGIVEVTDLGREKIQFVCDGCGAETIREYTARPRRVSTSGMSNNDKLPNMGNHLLSMLVRINRQTV